LGSTRWNKENETGQLMISSMTKRRRNAARTAAFAITALVAGLPLAESASAQQAAVQRARRAAPAPVINRVAFEGYRSVERAALESVIQTRARSTYDPAIVEADAQRIRDVYSRSGRSLAQVTPRVVQLANGEVDVVYTIV
jgi:outer membrane protein insertion porin family